MTVQAAGSAAWSAGAAGAAQPQRGQWLCRSDGWIPHGFSLEHSTIFIATTRISDSTDA